MFVPTRKSDEQIIIGQQIVSITVVENHRDSVCIGVIDPDDMPIEREELDHSAEPTVSEVLSSHPENGLNAS